MDMFGVDQAINGMIFWFLIVPLCWFIWVPVGAYVATQKRRSVIEGMLMGCLGPIGVLIAALLPTKTPLEP